MQRDPRAYLSDILEAASAIQDATRTISEAGYSQARLIRSAVEREFIIIGEALKVHKQEADFAAVSSGMCHGENWRGTPRSKARWGGGGKDRVAPKGALHASHRKVRLTDTAARPDPCRHHNGGQPGSGHAIAMAGAAAAVW